MENERNFDQRREKIKQLYLEVLDKIISEDIWISEKPPQHKGNLARTLLNKLYHEDRVGVESFALLALKTNLEQTILLLRKLAQKFKAGKVNSESIAVERNNILDIYQENVEYLIFFLVRSCGLSKTQIEGKLASLL